MSATTGGRAATARTGTVTTVLGRIDPGSLGVTMAHEHLIASASRDQTLTQADILDDLDLVRAAGARSIVELTHGHLGRDVAGLVSVARATGLQIVCATGFYQQSHYPDTVGALSVEALVAFLTSELVDGIDGTGVRAGIIGEIGSSPDRITPDEEKVFRASARASLATGAPISTHTGLGHLGAEQVALFESEGVPLSRVAIGHLDLIPDPDYHEPLARKGVFVQYDTFGKLAYQDDGARIACVVEMVRRGYADRIMLSCDISRPTYLKKHGGWGYVHLFDTIVPAIQREVGDEAVQAMLVDNPARFLAFADPSGQA